MNSVRQYLSKNWFWVAVNLAAFLPLALLAWDYAIDNLSVNPIDDFTDRTGKAAIILLLASLACTPVNTVFGFRKALTVRKSLGLWAFAYAALHLMVYIGLDYALDWNLIVQDALLEKRFIIVDAAMNDLTRPSLYGAFHDVKPVRETRENLQQVDVVGPICETGDFLAKDRMMPQVHSGDLLAVMSSGAYGFTMSSTYNSRPRVAEVLVSGDRFQVIREREGYDDLIRGEFLSEL